MLSKPTWLRGKTVLGGADTFAAEAMVEGSGKNGLKIQSREKRSEVTDEEVQEVSRKD
jgi:hypothetical protein